MPRVIRLVGDLTQTSEPKEKPKELPNELSLKQEAAKISFLDLTRELRDMVCEMAVFDTDDEGERYKLLTLLALYDGLSKFGDQVYWEFFETIARRDHIDLCLKYAIERFHHLRILTEPPRALMSSMKNFWMIVEEPVPNVKRENRLRWLKNTAAKVATALQMATDLRALLFCSNEQRGWHYGNGEDFKVGWEATADSEAMLNAILRGLARVPHLNIRFLKIYIQAISNWAWCSTRWEYEKVDNQWTSTGKAIMNDSREWKSIDADGAPSFALRRLRKSSPLSMP